MKRKLRIIVQRTSAAMAANVGGPVETEYLTFDVEAPDALVEALTGPWDQYGNRSFVGVQLLPEEPRP